MKAQYAYTAKAEKDGVGKTGDAVPEGADTAYLLAHEYARSVDIPAHKAKK